MHCWPQDNAVTHCLNNADQHNVQTPVQIPKLILLFKVGSSYQIRIYFRVKTSLFWPKSIIRFTHFVLEIQRRGKNGGGKMKWKKSPKFLQLVKIKLRVYFFWFWNDDDDDGCAKQLTCFRLHRLKWKRFWLILNFTVALLPARLSVTSQFSFQIVSLSICQLHLSSLFKSSLCLSVSSNSSLIFAFGFKIFFSSILH